jgi:hypothetical protein
MPVDHPEENTQHLEYSKSLKSRIYSAYFNSFFPKREASSFYPASDIYTTVNVVTCQMSLTIFTTKRTLKSYEILIYLQVSWVGSLTRQNSLSSTNCQPTQSQHQQLTPQNSLSSYHSSVYNGGRSGHSSSLQYDDNSKPINNLTARGTLFYCGFLLLLNVSSYLYSLNGI